MKRELVKFLAGFALGLLVVLLAAGCGTLPAPDTEPEHRPPGTKRITAAWSPPCLGPEPPCGGPWEDYILELRHGAGPWTFRLATPDTVASVTLTPGTWWARVAARQDTLVGPYSEESLPIMIKAPVHDDLPDIHREETSQP